MSPSLAPALACLLGVLSCGPAGDLGAAASGSPADGEAAEVAGLFPDRAEVAGLLPDRAEIAGLFPDRADPWAWLASDSAFAALVDRLSEPDRYFDTDNLISNERSYLHVIGGLEALGIRGGAYIGVGPDQNFSYIAAVRPEVAFIVDIRRDNLLQHLLLKAVLRAAPTRVEYLSLLFGRPPPAEPGRWVGRDLEALVERIDATPRDVDAERTSRETVLAAARDLGPPLSGADLETIARFHATFVREGLDLRFRSHGRAPQPYYPTYRQLLLERDGEGRRAVYLADEEGYGFVRSLSAANRIVPVVGDLAGEHALREIARLLAEAGTGLSAFYTSNVEFYLAREGSLGTFLDNLARLPRASRSVVIRSYFGGGFRRRHPHQLPGYASAQLLQPVDSLLALAAAGVPGYWELVTRGALDPGVAAPVPR